MSIFIKSLHTIKPFFPEKAGNGLSSWEEEIISNNCIDNFGKHMPKNLLNSEKYRGNLLKIVLFLSRKDR